MAGSLNVSGNITAAAGTFTGNGSFNGRVTIANTEPTISLGDSDHWSSFIQQNNNFFYVLSGCGIGSSNWCVQANGRWPLYINMTNNNAVFGGDINAFSFTTASDVRLKDEISTVSGLDIITRLRGVSFRWKDSGRPSIGLIAQEVEQVLPEIVSEAETTDPMTGEVTGRYKAVEYANLVAPLIEAVKEQQRQIEGLQDRIAALEGYQ